MDTTNINSKILPKRLNSGQFEPNLRFIQVLDELSTNTRIISKMLKTSVSGINVYTSKDRPKKLTLDFVRRLETVMPFLNIDFIMYGEDQKTGKMLDSFTRKLTDEELDSFKVKYGQKSPTKKGINQDRCERIYAIRMRRGDTQLSFSESLGCERHIVASIEGARQSATSDFLILLRRKLNVDIWWVLTGEGEMYIQYDAGDKSEVFKLRKKVDTLEKIIEKFIN